MHHSEEFQPPLYMPDLTPQPIRYNVRFPSGHPHYAEIEACIPTDGKLQVELFLPVWTPGSYLVREYSRHVECLSAQGRDESSLAVVKTRKNRWLVEVANPLHDLLIRYRLYCHELTVRTNFVDESFALLHGAATFVTLVNSPVRPHEVTLELPPQWTGSWSAQIGPLMDGSRNTFRAPDYDTLVDSPIVAGNPSIHSFEIDGKIPTLLNFGDAQHWDATNALGDLEKIVLQYRALWGELPYERYFFFNLLTGGRGALEHRNSMISLADRFTMRTHSSYAAWLDLVSHEFFHLWNVKRLRPRELGPFDYENEVYTRNLWIAEGFTEYYGPLTVRRAGLSTDAEFLGTDRAPHARGGPESITGWIEDLESTPGRLQQPVALASFDAWIKHYRPDENSPNSSVSYYTKGALIAWLLDAKVRAATGGAKTLDDVMRLAFHRYGGTRGFSADEFHETAQEVAGIDLKNWFTQVAETTEELDYGEAMAWFGLRFQTPAPPDSGESGGRAWLGFATKTEAGRLMVTEVRRGTPAYEAGVSSDDEILGIDDYRVRPDQWAQRLEQYRPHEVVSLLVARQDRLVNIRVRFGETPPRRWVVEVAPNSTDAQRQHLAAWFASLT